MAQSRGTEPNHRNLIYLTMSHELVRRVTDVGPDNDLALHIRDFHAHIPHRRTSDMARQHLMLHAMSALEKDMPA